MTKESWFNSWQEQKAFSNAAGRTLVPTASHSMGTRIFSPMDKAAEAAFSAKIKKEWSYTSTPPYGFYGMYKDNFTFNFTQLKQIIIA